MSRALRQLVFLATLALLLGTSVEARAGSGGTRYAFLVSCSKYLRSDFRELPYAENDVAAIRGALLATGFDPDYIVMVHDQAKERRYLPEKDKILTELDLLLDGMRPEDTLIVALSGHGLQFKGENISYFVPVDGRLGDTKTLIPLSGPKGLSERLHRCKAKKKLMIVNASRNDPTASLDFGGTKADLVDEDRKEVPEGIAVIYSCSAGQTSYVDPQRKMALFVDQFVRAWNDAHVNGTALDPAKLFAEVQRGTKKQAKQILSAMQTPRMAGDTTGWTAVTSVPPKVEVAKKPEVEKTPVKKVRPPATYTPSTGARQFAFLVACADYKVTELRKLPFTVRETQEFRDILLRSGFAENDIKFLHDGAPFRFMPSKANIEHELDLLLGRVGPNDSVLVLLNGHGLQYKGDRTGFFCPLDAQVARRDTLVSMETLFAQLKSCKAKRKLLLVNACRNDPRSEQSQATNQIPLVDYDEEVPEGIAALYACGKGQKSYFYAPDDPKSAGRKCSLFMHHLMQAWQGKYSTGPQVSVQEVFNQVIRRTAEDADVLFSERQNPQPKYELTGQWLIRVP